MAKSPVSESIDLLKARFTKTDKQLHAQPWFKRGAWLTSTHVSPSEAEAEGVIFQVYKKGWFNDSHQGIHVESFLSLEKEAKQSYVSFEILHAAQIPGTQMERVQLSRPFVDKIFDEVRAWDGYIFNEDKYAVRTFQKVLKSNAPDFEKTLAREIGKICSRLGPIMDQTLKSVLATK